MYVIEPKRNNHTILFAGIDQISGEWSRKMAFLESHRHKYWIRHDVWGILGDAWVGTIAGFQDLFAPCYSSTNFLGQLRQYPNPMRRYSIPRDLGGY